LTFKQTTPSLTNPKKRADGGELSLRTLAGFVLVHKHPTMALVTVQEPDFCTPRITMHIWLASMTTATPAALNGLDRLQSGVNRSCTLQPTRVHLHNSSELTQTHYFLFGI